MIVRFQTRCIKKCWSMRFHEKQMEVTAFYLIEHGIVLCERNYSEFSNVSRLVWLCSGYDVNQVLLKLVCFQLRTLEIHSVPGLVLTPSNCCACFRMRCLAAVATGLGRLPY